MRKMLLLVICIAVSLTGCFSTTKTLNKRFDAMDQRIDELAGEEVVREDIIVEQKETVTYVAPAVRATPISEKSVKVVMSKREIQTALRNAGYYQGPIDGKIGPKSKKAIKEFQSDNKLKVDGITGSKTKRVLIKYLSK